MREKLLQHKNVYKPLTAFHTLTLKSLFLFAYTDFKAIV